MDMFFKLFKWKPLTVKECFTNTKYEKYIEVLHKHGIHDNSDFFSYCWFNELTCRWDYTNLKLYLKDDIGDDTIEVISFFIYYCKKNRSNWKFFFVFLIMVSILTILLFLFFTLIL